MVCRRTGDKSELNQTSVLGDKRKVHDDGDDGDDDERMCG